MFGFFKRLQACKMAATAIQGSALGEDQVMPRLWSLVVFFESYLSEGSHGTKEDFGPKDPVDLKTVEEMA